MTVPPQPLGTEPQLSPAGQLVAGVQVQLLSVQTWPVPVQVPQLTVPPQPLLTVPQLAPAAAHAVAAGSAVQMQFPDAPQLSFLLLAEHEKPQVPQLGSWLSITHASLQSK